MFIFIFPFKLKFTGIYNIIYIHPQDAWSRSLENAVSFSFWWGLGRRASGGWWATTFRYSTFSGWGFYVLKVGLLRFQGGAATFSGWGYYICGFLMLRGCYVFRVEGGVVTTIHPHRSPLLKAIFNVLYAHANQSCKCTGAGSSAAQKTWTRKSWKHCSKGTLQTSPADC